jgi:membrane dipeptidase
MQENSRGRTTAIVIDGLNVAALSREQLKRTRQGGVTAINLTIVPTSGSFEECMAVVGRGLGKLAALKDLAVVATTAADIYAAKDTGRVAVVMGSQNAAFVENDLALLEIAKRVGVRIIQATHNAKNRLGSGAPFKGDDDTGMSEQGRLWLSEMERLGLLVDLSHCGLRTTAGFLAAATRPLVFSHANAHALWPSLRNKPDDMLRRVADLGGVTGAVMWTPTVRGDRWPTLDDYVDHIEHMVKVAGIEHIGFATDISDGIEEDPAVWGEAWGLGSLPTLMEGVGPWYGYKTERLDGYRSLSDTPRLRERLVARGMAEADADKVMGGNFLRVYREVWGG